MTTTRTRARWRRRATVLLLVGAVGVLWLWQRAEPIDLPWGDGGEPPAPSTSSDWEVVSVTDGDTLVVSQGGTEERVRLLGIDTPEVDDCGYAEATAAMAALVEGAEVTLVVGNSNDRDQYGRLLRYVEVGVPGEAVDVGLRLLESGLAAEIYDSRIGYPRHDREDAYIAADEAAPDLYSGNIAQTQAEGSLSRHGVAHGRELAYDTRVNSAKNWSVLDAVVEWALPQARSEADRLRAERQAQNAGSPDADAEGRRVDDRQFAETVSVLRLLQTSAMGWWTQRGHFRDDLIGNVYGSTDFVKRGLPADHGTKLRVSPDGQQTWFWRGTPSGWVLGIGLAANERGFLEWLYSASESPAGGPLDSPDEWGVAFETPPEWRS